VGQVAAVVGAVDQDATHPAWSRRRGDRIISLSPALRSPTGGLRSFTAFTETPLIRSRVFLKGERQSCALSSECPRWLFRCPFDTREENRLIRWEPPSAIAGRPVSHAANVIKLKQVAFAGICGEFSDYSFEGFGWPSRRTRLACRPNALCQHPDFKRYRLDQSNETVGRASP
jgi:hypothetical protein